MVSESQKIQVEKLAGENGSKISFDKVLMLADLPSEVSAKEGGEKIEIGRPYIVGKKIGAEIIDQRRLPKVITYKYHSKTRYRKKTGHRQPVTLVRIFNI